MFVNKIYEYINIYMYTRRVKLHDKRPSNNIN